MPTHKLQLFLSDAKQRIPKGEGAFNKVLEDFGLWGGTSNNLNTYYPGLNVNEDVVPKDEDFIRVPFRMLSATIVAGGTWRSTNFAKGNVLKKSRQKLVGKPVYIDHDTDTVSNVVGVIESVKYTEAFVDSKGTAVPGGIDGIIKIDAKSNPKIARAVLSNPPLIGSVSVTVLYDWQPSHTMDNADDFERNIGKMIDDKMVTRVATDIKDYYEISLVWLGADPYAKILKDGEPQHIDTSSAFPDSFAKEYYENEKKYHAELSLKAEKNIYLLNNKSGKPSDPEGNSPDNTDKNDRTMNLKALLEKLGVSKVEELSLDGVVITEKESYDALQTKADSVEALTTEKETLQGQVDTLTTEKEDLQGQVDTLTTDNAKLKEQSDAYNKELEAKRAEALRLYKLGTEKEDASIVALINESEGDTLAALTTQYKGIAVAKLGKSAVTGTEGGTEEPAAEATGDSLDSLREAYGKSSMNL